MSHYTVIETEIRDVPALRAAAAELGCKLEYEEGRKQTCKGYYRSQATACDAIITVPGSEYTVGLTRQPSGVFTMTADFWCDKLTKAVGEGCRKLIQLYGIHRATAAAKLQGYQVRRQPGQNGKINLVCSRA